MRIYQQGGSFEQSLQEALADFLQDPTVYMEASKNTDTPLDENLVNQIMEMAQTNPDQLMAAISQDEALSNTITSIYNAKKQSSPMMKDGGKIAYLNCLKSGGAIADCGCKKVSKAEKGKKTTDSMERNRATQERITTEYPDGTKMVKYEVGANNADGWVTPYYESGEGYRLPMLEKMKRFFFGSKGVPEYVQQMWKDYDSTNGLKRK